MPWLAPRSLGTALALLALATAAGCSDSANSPAGASAGTAPAPGPSAGSSAGGNAASTRGGAGMGAGGSAGTATGGGAAAAVGGAMGGAEAAGGATAGQGGAGMAGGGSGGATGLLGTQAIMVVGSSNELITCWRALLWQELRQAGIENFDFVGGVSDGPDCGVPGYDKDLQAQSGIVVSKLPASTFQGWFTAHPPDIILMHFGGADLLQNMPVAGVLEAYSLALEQARLVNPKVRLMIAQHTPQDSGGCNACQASVLELNADIVTWAAAKTTGSSPVTVVDLYTGLVPATDLSDGVHLNDAGSKKVADRWFAALEPLFKP